MKTIKFLENQKYSVRLAIDTDKFASSSPYSIQMRQTLEDKYYVEIWHGKTSPKRYNNMLRQICQQLNGKKQKSRLFKYLCSIKGQKTQIKDISVKDIVGKNYIVINYN